MSILPSKNPIETPVLKMLTWNGQEEEQMRRLFEITLQVEAPFRHRKKP
jgi:hypothetical protein